MFDAPKSFADSQQHHKFFHQAPQCDVTTLRIHAKQLAVCRSVLNGATVKACALGSYGVLVSCVGIRTGPVERESHRPGVSKRARIENSCEAAGFVWPGQRAEWTPAARCKKGRLKERERKRTRMAVARRRRFAQWWWWFRTSGEKIQTKFKGDALYQYTRQDPCKRGR